MRKGIHLAQMKLRILYQDQDVVAVDKPAGFHVHPPEDPSHQRGKTCMQMLRNQLGCWVYPVHRLDFSTAGVLLFGLSSESASKVAKQFSERSIEKKYLCVVRGWTDDSGTIETPLKNETKTAELPSRTRYETLARIELPYSTQPQFETSRFSLVRAYPETGRFHQIRRHMASIKHPLIGDRIYGSRIHNRLFKEKLDLPRLLLRATSIRFELPSSAEKLKLRTRYGHEWHQVFDLFGFCPLP